MGSSSPALTGKAPCAFGATIPSTPFAAPVDVLARVRATPETKEEETKKPLPFLSSCFYISLPPEGSTTENAPKTTGETRWGRPVTVEVTESPAAGSLPGQSGPPAARSRVAGQKGPTSFGDPATFTRQINQGSCGGFPLPLLKAVQENHKDSKCLFVIDECTPSLQTHPQHSVP